MNNSPFENSPSATPGDPAVLELVTDRLSARRCPRCREREIRTRPDGSAWCGACGEELGLAIDVLRQTSGGDSDEIPRWAMMLAGLVLGAAVGGGIGFYVGIQIVASVLLGGILGALVGAFTNTADR